MKNPSDPLGNRTHDLLVCSALPQPTAPPRIPKVLGEEPKIMRPHLA